MIVFLIGFMGSGKSTLGKPVARALDYRFIDMDDYIQEQTGMSVADIFVSKGEAEFRRLESYYLQQIAQMDNVLVSTGGGVPCFNSNMDFMKRVGVTVYLKQTPATLARRLANARNKRPLIAGKTPQELLGYIESMLQQREQYYNQASIVVDNPDRDAKRIINTLTLMK